MIHNLTYTDMIRKGPLTRDVFVCMRILETPLYMYTGVYYGTLLRHEKPYYHTVGGCTFPSVHGVSGMWLSNINKDYKLRVRVFIE